MDNPRCLHCKTPLISLGQLPMRTGGISGADHPVALFFLGDSADSAEKVLYFDLYRCNTCSRLEFYDHDRSLPRA